jgi:uncharacterized protein YukE
MVEAVPVQQGVVAVDPAAVRAHGADVCGLAERLAEVRRRWAPLADEPGGACGYREITQVYAETQDAWFAELGVYVRVLEELCAGIDAAANDYQGSDGVADEEIAAARPGRADR